MVPDWEVGKYSPKYEFFLSPPLLTLFVPGGGAHCARVFSQMYAMATILDLEPQNFLTFPKWRLGGQGHP